jgi:predicted Rossmann fold nucleotide-binding protein DprA/Smf involved in DNA uptake
VSESLSPDTQATLLLTAPLILGGGGRGGRGGGGERTADVLGPAEYRELARRLRELGRQPADLLTPAGDRIVRDCESVIERVRLERLLARGFALSQAVERWHARAIWVVSRADADYPQRWKTRLKDAAPAVLYGCGTRRILDSGGLAIVGSRHVDEEPIEFAQEVGRLVASARRTVVSGGARGIDQAAMRGAQQAGGTVVGVLGDSLERAATSREHRDDLMEGRLALISPYDPGATFNVGRAMQRNKLVYALADAALVVSAELDKGGTWAGATEQLDVLHSVPVYVRSNGKVMNGLDALRRKGALPWPDPQDAEGLNAVLSASVAKSSKGQPELFPTT